MKPIAVVSVGPGTETGLTLQAHLEIAAAVVVFCAPRCAELAQRKETFALSPFEQAIEKMKALAQKDIAVAVLVSGDAGLYSLLPLLKKKLGGENLRVIAGVSSLQTFMAAQGMPWQDARILSAHGRELSESALCHEARTHEKTLLLLDEKRGPHWVREALQNGGVAAELIIGEKIGYPDQSVAPWEDREYDPLSVALILNSAPENGLPFIGLADDAFERGKTPMTKREIRVSVLAALRLKPGSVVWDVGAGTGSVSVECARQCPWGKVYAVERNSEALELIERNRQKFHLSNLTIVSGEAPEALRELPVPTHVFLGGVGQAAEAVIADLQAFKAPIRLVATAVTLESLNGLAALMRDMPDFTASQITVSRLEQMGRYTMFRAQNPVALLAADLRAKEEEE